eukprot:jgi/Mesvir1/12666/Mv02214-RA.2
MPSGKGIVMPRWVNHCPFNLLIYFCLLQYVTTLLYVTGEIEASSCPCEICPCYCPCADRRAFQFAIVGHADSISDQSYNSDGSSSTRLQLFSGAKKAARDRDFQLSPVYRPFSADDASKLLRALDREESVNGIVATLYNEMYMEVLVEATLRGIPVYVVGSTSAPLLGLVRQRAAQAAAARESSNGNSNAAIQSTLRHIGQTTEATASQLAERLISVGIRRIDCIYTNVENVAFQQRCEALVAHFQAAGLIGVTHFYVRLVMPLVAALEELSSDIAAGTVAENLTALVLPDAPMYQLFNDARGARGRLRTAHVAVFESSSELLEDIREGKPITVVDQASYSEAYAAVALAAYELQVGEALTSDLAPSVRLLSNGEVTDADMMRVLCREEGYPVCGDPGVPEVTPRGCPCFDRTSTRLEELSTVPRAAEVHHTLAAGLRDGEHDFPGTQSRWEMKGEATFSATLALQAITAVLANATWTAMVNADYYAALVNPLISETMEAIGRTKGNRTIWLTFDRDEDMPLQQFLDKYNADGYVGTTAGGTELLGAYARSHLRSNGDRTLVLAPIGITPKWMQMARGFVNGFFNNTLAYPDRLWVFPFRQYCSNEPVAFRFHDGWTQDMSPCYSPLADRVEAGAGANLSGSYPAMLDLIQTPPPLSERHTFMGVVREALRAGNVSGMNYGTMAVLPIMWEDVPLLIHQAEESRARGPQGDTKIMSFFCLSSDFQLFAYPDTIPGSSRHSACLDWQSQLTSYIAYMAAQLEQQTRGERLFRGAVPTDRLLTRDSLGPRARQRMADCHLHRRRTLAENGTDTSFAVCDYAASCGGNASMATCSGRGWCQFPTARMNARTPGGLVPSQGWCVCHKGAKGLFCELDDDDNHMGLALGIALGISLPLLLLLPMVSYLPWKGLIAVAGNRRHDVDVIRSQPPGKCAEIIMVHTDIEGSTQLWEHDPEMMDHSLQVHHRVLRLLLGIHHGYECNTEGDAFEVVFHRAGDAVRWACEVQLALLRPETLLAPKGIIPFHSKLLCTWPESLQSHEVGRLVLGPDGTTLFRGLRVRMGIHRGVPEANFRHSTSGRQRYEGRVVDVARAIVNAASQGGQVLMSSSTWASLTPSEIIGLNLVVHHLGEHILTGHLMPMQLLEVLPQSLQKRAPFAPLRSRQQLSPSFFDAPAASSFVRGTPPSEPMCIMFTFVKPSMRLKQNLDYESALATFVSFTRRLLRTHRGYECEERNGDFLLAFGSLVDAVQFSQALQVGAMALPWPRSILEEAEAEAVALTFATQNGNADSPGCVLGPPATSTPWLFRGLRIKCGFYWGIPTRCLPHGSTGRAAYFGPLMNRAARIASYASAGQTLCNSEAVEAYNEACKNMDDKVADPAVLPVTFTFIGSPGLKVRNV